GVRSRRHPPRRAALPTRLAARRCRPVRARCPPVPGAGAGGRPACPGPRDMNRWSAMKGLHWLHWRCWRSHPWTRAIVAVLYVLALYAIVQAGWQRRALWRGQLVDKGIGGDGIQYWEMAVHLEREHMASLDGKKPTWLRLPGYPMLLRLTTHPAAS